MGRFRQQDRQHEADTLETAEQPIKPVNRRARAVSSVVLRTGLDCRPLNGRGPLEIGLQTGGLGVPLAWNCTTRGPNSSVVLEGWRQGSGVDHKPLLLFILPFPSRQPFLLSSIFSIFAPHPTTHACRSLETPSSTILRLKYSLPVN